MAAWTAIFIACASAAALAPPVALSPAAAAGEAVARWCVATERADALNRQVRRLEDEAAELRSTVSRLQAGMVDLVQERSPAQSELSSLRHEPHVAAVGHVASGRHVA